MKSKNAKTVATSPGSTSRLVRGHSTAQRWRCQSWLSPAAMRSWHRTASASASSSADRTGCRCAHGALRPRSIGALLRAAAQWGRRGGRRVRRIAPLGEIWSRTGPFGRAARGHHPRRSGVGRHARRPPGRAISAGCSRIRRPHRRFSGRDRHPARPAERVKSVSAEARAHETPGGRRCARRLRIPKPRQT
eukprot:COSAG02_NODE_924_length_15868_cov_165.380430_7_plen_191_part_00